MSEWSKYNMLFESKKHGFFLYNSRVNNFYKLTSDLYVKLKGIEEDISSIDSLDNETFVTLQENKIIVNGGEDYLYFSKTEYMKRKKSFLGRDLSLVIVPTMGCNFKCPYCYEQNLPNVKMSEDIQNKVISFINKFQNKCDNLSIYWHGGEPLMAFDVIKNLLYKIKTEVNLPLIDQSMVSNGYLFNKEVCKLFKEFPLNYVQITVDGLEDTHNLNRIHKAGLPTYGRIIDNIDFILNDLPETLVGVRMNIHNDNKDEYYTHLKKLSLRWEGKKCTIYPAFVLPQGGNCNVSCLTPYQKAKFYIDLYNDYKMNVNFFPKMQLGTCSAIYENHFVIDPVGVLYKCWADLGHEERAVGDIFSGITKWDFVAAYSVGSDKFTDDKCKDCKIFPICDGGCNRFRTDHQLLNYDYDVCQIDSSGLEKYLEIIYEQQLNTENCDL